MKAIINNYENYEIYDDGRVYSINRDIFLKQVINNCGYVVYCLSKDGKQKWKFAHKLVAEHFINNPNKYSECNHIDGNKLNNSLFNLEWCTRSHNVKHSHDMGFRKNVKYAKGVLHYNTKINSEIAKEIRLMKRSGFKIVSIAVRFNISESCVKNVIYRGDWI